MALPLATDSWTGSIESLSQEGLGIGTMHVDRDGKRVHRPIFVPFSVPGDTVRARVVEQKRKYSFGELQEVVTPSAHRVVPLCPHFTVCGGCNLQHVAYDEQLRQKAQQIQFLLVRKGAQLPKDVVVLPSKERHHYRWRAKIAVQFGSRITAGFRKFHSHEIVEVKTCFIVAPQILELIKRLNDTQCGIQQRFTQEIITVVGESKKLGVLVPLDETPPEMRRLVRACFEDLYARNRRLIGNLFFQEGRETRTSGQVQEHITYKGAGLTYSFLPETFIQSNIPTNEVLLERAEAMIFHGDAATGPKRVQRVIIDLYAGIGNISLPLARRSANLIAVEGHEASALLGRINMYTNKIENALFIHRSAEKYISEYVKHRRANNPTEEYPVASALVIDPPRTGCAPAVISGLLNSGIDRILYVSCNPVTLASDLQLLSTRYGITDIVGIDMFPDISHVETLVLLDRKSTEEKTDVKQNTRTRSTTKVAA